MIIAYDEKGRIKFTAGYFSEPEVYIEFLKTQGLSGLVIEDGLDPVFVCEKMFVWGDRLEERPILSLISQGNSFSVEDIPEKCLVKMDGDLVNFSGGKFEFEITDPGKYILEIEAWPYMSFSQEIEIK